MDVWLQIIGILLSILIIFLIMKGKSKKERLGFYIILAATLVTLFVKSNLLPLYLNILLPVLIVIVLLMIADKRKSI